MNPSKKQQRILITHLLVDPKFRKRLLTKPRKAARKVGVHLSSRHETLFLESADKIKEIGRRFDSLIDIEGFIPFSAGGGKDESKKKKKKKKKKPG